MIIIVIGAIVLTSAAELTIPRSFNRHMAAMGPMMTGMMDTDEMGMDMNSDLFINFRAAVNESLMLATGAAMIAALVVSILVSRRVVAPVQEMMVASQRVAEGRYEERVKVPGPSKIEEMDELAQLAISFNQMADKLEKTEELRRDLIADVMHELRTPLATIKGSMEGLIDGVLTPGEKMYQTIFRETDRLQRLVSDLQELSRVEAGAYQLDMQSARVSDLVQAVVARLDQQFKEKGVLLHTEIPTSEFPQVMVDEDRIGQVFINLLGNALQYTPPGGEVQIKAFLDQKQVHIAISDSGLGIPPEHLPHIFTRFYRVDKSRSRVGGGSGIGLTITKHLVEAHGGRIWAESQGKGKGSTFHFTLPIAT
jgi:histidine kinase